MKARDEKMRKRLSGLSPVATSRRRWIFIEGREAHTVFMPCSIKHFSIRGEGINFVSINVVSIIHTRIREKKNETYREFVLIHSAVVNIPSTLGLFGLFCTAMGSVTGPGTLRHVDVYIVPKVRPLSIKEHWLVYTTHSVLSPVLLLLLVLVHLHTLG